MNKDLFERRREKEREKEHQLMQGRFRVGQDAAPAEHYVCKSDVWGTNGADRPSWEKGTLGAFMYRVHR